MKLLLWVFIRNQKLICLCCDKSFSVNIMSKKCKLNVRLVLLLICGLVLDLAKAPKLVIVLSCVVMCGVCNNWGDGV